MEKSNFVFRNLTNPMSPAAEFHGDSLRRTVIELAGVIGERNVYQYSNLCQASDFIEHSFLDAGYRPIRQEYQASRKTFANIEVELKGENFPEEIIIVGAHYDSARGSPGANDNASGIAALLALCRSFAHKRISRTIRFVAFTNEERPFLRTPHMGSRVYASRSRARSEIVKAMFSLETIGYYSKEKGSQWLSFFGSVYPARGDFILFVANGFSRDLLNQTTESFPSHTDIPFETAILPSFAPGARSSDHWSFWKEGYPGLMVTDTAPLRYPHYHKPTDTPDKLRYDFLNGIVRGVQGVLFSLVG
jgi:Zn-dependent M28 family amino/carboxypeptidase